MAALRVRGIRTLMVEGGAKIICKFLKQKLVNYCVITITPKLIGGLNAVDGTCRTFSQPPLTVSECRYHALGSDLIAFGRVSYQ
jgi:3,4-dihydroxy 2-butanone 4-phosphate synthase/GTP cyclohydrolase II